MINTMLTKMRETGMDVALVKMLTEDYPANPYTMVTATQKLTLTAIMEAGMRAKTGLRLQRPIGGPVVLSPWEKILFNSKQLFQLPTPSLDNIQTKTIIGPNAKKPLVLDIPIIITGMSYGGSLNMNMKIALAKGASMAGTSTNTGESAVTNEERDNAKLLIGQYHRGGWLNTADQLERLDAIEVQLGQGAFGGAVESTIKASNIGEHLRNAWHLSEGQDAKISSRMDNVNSPQDIINLINSLKGQYEVPIGIKIAGSDYIELDLEIICQSKADYIVIDGSEGGTAAASPILEDNVGLPTLHSLARAVNWLKDNNVRDKFSLIAAGGLNNPGHFLKAMAIGADAVYIGSIALMASLQSQIEKAFPQGSSLQLALYTGKLKDQLDVDRAAQDLSRFLFSCKEEMKVVVQAIGKNAVKELNRTDLVTIDKELAEFLSIRYALSARSK